MGPGVRARGQPLERRLCGPYLVPGKAISSETQVQVRTHMPAALRGLHRPPATPLARPSCPEVHTELGCGGWGRPGWQRALHLVLESRPGVGGRRRGCRAPTKPKGGSGRGPQPCGGSSGDLGRGRLGRALRGHRHSGQALAQARDPLQAHGAAGPPCGPVMHSGSPEPLGAFAGNFQLSVCLCFVGAAR